MARSAFFLLVLTGGLLAQESPRQAYELFAQLFKFQKFREASVYCAKQDWFYLEKLNEKRDRGNKKEKSMDDLLKEYWNQVYNEEWVKYQRERYYEQESIRKPDDYWQMVMGLNVPLGEVLSVKEDSLNAVVICQGRMSFPKGDLDSIKQSMSKTFLTNQLRLTSGKRYLKIQQVLQDGWQGREFLYAHAIFVIKENLAWKVRLFSIDPDVRSKFESILLENGVVFL